ncbi:MAG: NosD domain-containing protein [Candidatus Bathyarchaeia archaeon]
MSKKFASILIIFFLLFTLRFWKDNQVEIRAAPSSRVHNLNTGLDYTAIQEAIDAPQTKDGHVIFAEEGTYFEHVTIFKSISLVGAKRDATIIDGNGIGTVVQITANNVNVVNFTIRNAGKMWSGTGYPPSGISGNGVWNVNVTNNILADAAVCAWFYFSSFVNVSGNVILNATIAGIIGYNSSNIVIHQNFVDNCGFMGIHLDSNSSGCNITNNSVIRTLEGIEIEKSAKNLIARNQLESNNVSLVLNQCNGLNIFRENNMTSEWYNIVVWGWTLDAFMQDFDTTNTVNGKTVYYFTNSRNSFINESNCPNIGYLAIVNCTDVTIKDVDLSYNRDGLLLAQSTNCTLLNITLNGNRGPLLYGGLTLFKSSNNIIVNSLISNNTVGICAYQSNGNIFYHNAFIGNTINVISNFSSPFSPPSGALSKNVWDSGYPNGGNYWSDYNGIDMYSGSYQNETGSDGLGDSSFAIDKDNQDNYPLMGRFYDFEVVGFYDKIYHVQVISNSTVSELNLVIWLSSPNEYLQLGQAFLLFYVKGEDYTRGFCRIVIPRALLNNSYIVLVDWKPVPARQLNVSNSTYAYLYFTYNHTKHEVIIISEFTLTLTPPLVLTATLIAVLLLKAKAKNIKNRNFAS